METTTPRIDHNASNIQVKENGIITFTREITWLTGMSTGWGNGYVALPEGHKYYGVNYDDVPVDVHYGLTYGESEEIDGKSYWVVGFDCAHLGDDPYSSPQEFVIAETERLYQQLI